MDEPKKTSSRPGKIIKLVAVFLFVGFVVAIVIPNFIHARLAKASNACVNNLRQIESAKEQWVMENNKRPDDIPPATEIVAYFKDHRLPACPEGGTYTTNMDFINYDFWVTRTESGFTNYIDVPQYASQRRTLQWPGQPPRGRSDWDLS